MLEVYIHKISNLQKNEKFYKSCLTKEELERFSKMKNKKISMSYLCCRGRLKELLSEKTKIKAYNLKLQYNKYGKPSLKNFDKYYFNLSHSRNICSIAYSFLSPVGVDVEYKNFERSVDLMAKRIFSLQEKNHYKKLVSKESQCHYFFERWTLKESISKAIGKGMSISFDKIDPKRRNNFFTIDCEGIWNSKHVDFDKDYLLSVTSKNIKPMKIII